jgi:hypothetical protein
MKTTFVPPPRNPWPMAIVVAFVLFLTGTAGLIALSVGNRMDLVTADYYEQEVRYQEQIDRAQQTRTVKVRVDYRADQGRIVLRLPPEHAARQPAGSIHLYRPSAAGLDRRMALGVGADGAQSVDTRSLTSGLWRIRITWNVEGKDYYFDQSVIVRSNTT